MAEAMNRELRQLAASGCKVIQVEEPTLHFMARYNPEKKDLLDFLVDCFNREVEGLDDVEVWIHTCWGNPNMQKVFTDESYANSIEIYLERLKGDVWTIEATENDLKELPLFKPYADSLKKKIAVGVISHRTLQADFPDVVADRIRRASRRFPADKLVLSTDCGFGRQGFNRHLAFYKTSAIPLARNIVLKELGLEPRYVPAADERLAWDQLPDDEPFTHLKPLRYRCGPTLLGLRVLDAQPDLRGGPRRVRRRRRRGHRHRRGRSFPRRRRDSRSAQLRDSGLKATLCLPAALSILPIAIGAGADRPERERIESALRVDPRLAAFEPEMVMFLTGAPATATRPRHGRSSSRASASSGRSAARRACGSALEPIHRSASAEFSLVTDLPGAEALLDEAGDDSVGIPVRHLAPLGHAGRARARAPTRRPASRPCTSTTGGPRRGTGTTGRSPARAIMDLPAIIGALEAGGYDGWYDMEVFSGEEYPDSLMKLDPAELVRRGREGFIRAWEARHT